MPISHLLLALFVVVIWGVNFIFIKLALRDISPLFLCAVRFLLASVPVIFFIKRPSIPFKILLQYGLIVFALQFTLVFIGMNSGMTAGMASLLMQVQIFFSMFFAAILLKETPTIWQILGALISFIGIGLVGVHLDHSITWIGFLCILGAAASWGVGNLISKQMKNVNMIAVVIWGSFIASPPMFILTFLFEGKTLITQSIHQISLSSLLALFYIVYVSTWVGYGLWNWLLSKHPVSTIVPFTLLVPIVGMLSSIVFLNESLESWKVIAGSFVIGGLCINLLGAKLFIKKTIQIKNQTERLS
jgi:O-acetylserine/cysteine efflux transporter